MNILYTTINPFEVKNRRLQYNKNLDLSAMRGQDRVSKGIPVVDESGFRNLFAHQEKMDWVGDSLLDAQLEKLWVQEQTTKENDDEDDDILSVVVDLSAFQSN